MHRPLELSANDPLAKHLVELRKDRICTQIEDDWHLVADLEDLPIFLVALFLNGWMHVFDKDPRFAFYTILPSVLFAFAIFKRDYENPLKDSMRLREVMLYGGPRTTADLVEMGADEATVERLSDFQSIYLKRFNSKTPLDYLDLVYAETYCQAWSWILLTLAHLALIRLDENGLYVACLFVGLAVGNTILRSQIRAARRYFERFIPKDINIVSRSNDD